MSSTSLSLILWPVLLPDKSEMCKMPEHVSEIYGLGDHGMHLAHRERGGVRRINSKLSVGQLRPLYHSSKKYGDSDVC